MRDFDDRLIKTLIMLAVRIPILVASGIRMNEACPHIECDGKRVDGIKDLTHDVLKVWNAE